METMRRIFICLILVLLLGIFESQLSHCKSNGVVNKKLLFKLIIRVLPEVVEIKIQNLNGLTKLDENLIIEKLSEKKDEWIFAACPLWFCGTKETVFSQEIKAGEVSIVKWNKKLHKHCQRAPAGKYRALIKGHDGILLSVPVEFIIGE